jgi:hypothetical protein
MRLLKGILGDGKKKGSGSADSSTSSNTGATSPPGGKQKVGGSRGDLPSTPASKRPSIDEPPKAPSVDEDEDLKPSAPNLDVRRMNSLRKIQQFARRKRAQRLARLEQHWKVI